MVFYNVVTQGYMFESQARGNVKDVLKKYNKTGDDYIIVRCSDSLFYVALKVKV